MGVWRAYVDKVRPERIASGALEQPLPPTLIQRLEAKIKAPGDKSMSVLIPGLDPETARAVYNTAIRVAIGVLKATRNVARAVEAALAHIRSQVKAAFDETAIRQEIERDLIRPPEPSDPRVISASKVAQGMESVPVASAVADGLFSDSVLQRHGNDFQGAWDEIRRIPPGRRRDISMAGLLDALAGRWQTGGNMDPVVAHLMQTVSTELRQSKSVEAQDLRGQAAVNEKLATSMPIYSWLGLLKQRRDDLVGKIWKPETVQVLINGIVQAGRRQMRVLGDALGDTPEIQSIYNIAQRILASGRGDFRFEATTKTRKSVV